MKLDESKLIETVTQTKRCLEYLKQIDYRAYDWENGLEAMIEFAERENENIVEISEQQYAETLFY